MEVNLLEQGARLVDRLRNSHMAGMVVYQSGGQSVELRATTGRTEFEQVDEYGVVQRIESRDLLVHSEDLMLSGQPVLPKSGDRILQQINGKTEVYTVMAPGGVPPYRFSDPQWITMRIHTKHTGTEQQ